jgi:hypothetical protein
MPNIVNDWLITMPAGVNAPHGLIKIGGYWVVSFHCYPGYVSIIDPANPTAFRLVQFLVHNWGMDVCANPLNGKALIVWQGGAVVSELDLITLAWTDVIPGGGAGQGSICTDGTYCYVANWDTSTVDKYRLSDWSFVASLNPGLSFDYAQLYSLHCIRYDGTYIYVTTAAREEWSSPRGLPKIAKIDPATFTVIDSAGIPGGHDQLTDDFAITPTHIVCGSELDGSIIFFDKSNLSSQVVVDTSGLGLFATCYGVRYDGNLIWAVFYGGSKIISVDPSTYAITVYSFPDNSLQVSPNEIWNDGNKFVVTFYTGPGSISQFTFGAGATLAIAGTPPSGTVGVAYSYQMTVSGGTAPYTTTISVGSLPGGLGINSSGLISGTPTTAGAFSFTVHVVDASSATADQPCNVTIGAATTTLSLTGTPTNGSLGVAYSYGLTIAGGTGPYTVGISLGALPPGMSVSNAGVISGTPTLAGAFSFTVQLADSTPALAPLPCSITITGPAALAISGAPLAGTFGSSYSYGLTLYGGTPRYVSVRITAGALPAGLSIDDSGVISGTPSLVGTFSFTATVTDSASVTESVALSITIAPPASARLAYCKNGWLYFDFIDINRARQTLAYKVDAPGWWFDHYSPGVVLHYQDEATNSITVLCGCADGTITQFSAGAADTGGDISCAATTAAFNLGDFRNLKQFGDAFVDATAMTVNLLADNLATSVGSAVLTGVQNVNRIPIDIGAGLGSQNVNLALAFTWTGAGSLFGFEIAALPKPERTALRTTDWVDLGQSMWLQGFRITANTFGVARTVQVQWDGYPTGGGEFALTMNHNGEVQLPYSFTPVIAHRIRLTPADGGDVWEIFNIEPIGTPAPEATGVWHPQPSSFGVEGYLHVRELRPAVMGTGSCVISGACEFGSWSVTVALSGAYQKVYLPLPPNKGIYYDLSITGTAVRVFADDFEVVAKQWASTGTYAVLRPFGQPNTQGARI